MNDEIYTYKKVDFCSVGNTGYSRAKSSKTVSGKTTKICLCKALKDENEKNDVMR